MVEIGNGLLGKRKARSIAVADESENLSDIDDAEVSGYINSEKEVSLKKVIWEAMNKAYMKGKENQRKEPSKEKRSNSTKKKTNVGKEVENKKKPNLKINYAALAELLDEPVKDAETETAKGSKDSDRGNHGPVELQPDDQDSCFESVQYHNRSYMHELDPDSDYNEHVADTEFNEELDTNIYYGNEDEGDEYGVEEEFGYEGW